MFPTTRPYLSGAPSERRLRPAPRPRSCTARARPARRSLSPSRSSSSARAARCTDRHVGARRPGRPRARAPAGLRAQLGDRVAYARLFERHHAPVLRYVHGLLGNGDDAEDVIQDVWVTIVRSPHSSTRPRSRAGCTASHATAAYHDYADPVRTGRSTIWRTLRTKSRRCGSMRAGHWSASAGADLLRVGFGAAPPHRCGSVFVPDRSGGSPRGIRGPRANRA